MAFSPTFTHESAAVPGVTVTLQRMGFSRRTDLAFETLKYRQRVVELEAEYPQPSEEEKTKREQLAIAEKKAALVPHDKAAEVLENEVLPLMREVEAAVSPESKKQRDLIDAEYFAVEMRIKEAWIRAGLLGIAGGELDGMTAEQLLDYGPPALAHEIYRVLSGDAQIRGEASKNLPSPITSGGQADGTGEKSQSTTAQPAADQQAAGT